MAKKLIFYTIGHNGDLHTSRTFVKELCKYAVKNNMICCYNHLKAREILYDIDNLEFNTVFKPKDMFLPYYANDDEIGVNTWPGANYFKYVNLHGISLDCLYDMFNDFTKTNLNFELSAISEDKGYFLPEIDFSRIDTKNIDDWVKLDNRKKIFISNGEVLSNQSRNFDFNPIIDELSDDFKDYIFVLTNDGYYKKENIVYSKDIIKSDKCDLNENSYLSTFCDIIIGRCSGTHTFSTIKQNLYNLNKHFLIASFIDPNFYNNLLIKAEYVHIKSNDIIEIQRELIDNIKRIYG